MNAIKYSFYENILFKLFYFLLLVDTINGFFLGFGQAIPLGQIYKFFILLFFIFYLVKTKEGYGFILLLLGYECFYVYLLAEKFYVSNIGDTLSLLSKFLMVCMGYPIFIHLVRKNSDAYFGKVRKIVFLNSLVILFNIVVGLAGFGFSTYDATEDGSGSKGFFYAVNELSGVIIYLSGFLFFYFKRKLSTKRFIAFFLFVLACVTVFGTKTALGGIFFFFIFLQYKYAKVNKILMLILLVLVIPLLLYVGYLIAKENGIWERWTYFYERSDDIYTFLLSGRDTFWENMRDDFFAKGLWAIIFGAGGVVTVEMDPFDALMNFGIVGLVVVYGFWILMTYNAYKLKKINTFANIVFFLDVEILIFSLFAGHLMFSGMMGPFVPLINGLAYVPNNVLDKYIKAK